MFHIFFFHSIHFTVRLLHCHLLNLRFGLKMNRFYPNQKLFAVEKSTEYKKKTIEQIMFTFVLRFVFTLSLVLFKPIIGRKFIVIKTPLFILGIVLYRNGWINIKYCTLNSILHRATKKNVRILLWLFYPVE